MKKNIIKRLAIIMIILTFFDFIFPSIFIKRYGTNSGITNNLGTQITNTINAVAGDIIQDVFGFNVDDFLKAVESGMASGTYEEGKDNNSKIIYDALVQIGLKDPKNDARNQGNNNSNSKQKNKENPTLDLQRILQRNGFLYSNEKKNIKKGSVVFYSRPGKKEPVYAVVATDYDSTTQKIKKYDLKNGSGETETDLDEWNDEDDNKNYNYLCQYNFPKKLLSNLTNTTNTGGNKVANCGISENGTIYCGQLGDNNGKEYQVKDWYSHGWYAMFRTPNEELAQEIAAMATEAANNDSVGYCQDHRATWWNELKKVNYDPSAVTTPCAADCSSSTAAAINCAFKALGMNEQVDSGMTTDTTEANLTRVRISRI